MDLLHRDVLPKYFASLGLTFNEYVSQNQGTGQLLEIVEQMAAVGSFMSRLVQAINFDIFDEHWKGDRV